MMMGESRMTERWLPAAGVVVLLSCPQRAALNEI